MVPCRGRLSYEEDNLDVPIGWARSHIDQSLLVHGRPNGSVGVGDGEPEGHDRRKQDNDVEQRCISKSAGPVFGEDGHDGDVIVCFLKMECL